MKEAGKSFQEKNVTVFKKKGNKICGIGNNVTIGFKKLNFGTAGARYVTIAGATPLEKTSIVLKFLQNGEEKQCIIEFVNGSSIQRFSIDPLVWYFFQVANLILSGFNLRRGSPHHHLR